MLLFFCFQKLLKSFRCIDYHLLFENLKILIFFLILIMILHQWQNHLLVLLIFIFVKFSYLVMKSYSRYQGQLFEFLFDYAHLHQVFKILLLEYIHPPNLIIRLLSSFFCFHHFQNLIINLYLMIFSLVSLPNYLQIYCLVIQNL